VRSSDDAICCADFLDDEQPIERNTSQLVRGAHGLLCSLESAGQRFVSRYERGAEVADGDSVGRQLQAPRLELTDDVAN
jgi:hypothetical protein